VVCGGKSLEVNIALCVFVFGDGLIVLCVEDVWVIRRCMWAGRRAMCVQVCSGWSAGDMLCCLLWNLMCEVFMCGVLCVFLCVKGWVRVWVMGAWIGTVTVWWVVDFCGGVGGCVMGVVGDVLSHWGSIVGRTVAVVAGGERLCMNLWMVVGLLKSVCEFSSMNGFYESLYDSCVGGRWTAVRCFVRCTRVGM
jgi:hypothetical protein